MTPRGPSYYRRFHVKHTEKPRWLKWDEIFARDADFNLIIAKRELGKSFGAREQTLRDYRDNGERCVAIVRYKDDIQVAITDFYADVVDNTTDNKLKAWLSKQEFNIQGNQVMIRAKSDGKHKNKWDLICRMIPLSKATRYKMATMNKVRRVLFDEALIDKRIDSYTRYLPNEYRLLQNLVGTLQRYSEKDGAGHPRLRVYLMGNAVDLINPYFAALGITAAPDFGYRWYRGKSWFFAYPDPADYATKNKNAELAERMGGSASDYANEFEAGGDAFIGRKPSNARFDFGVAYNGETFGLWLDDREGYYYVNTKIPKDTPRPIFALSTSDNRPNYIVAKSANKTLKGISDLYCFGCLKFDSPGTRERFNAVLSLFGVR